MRTSELIALRKAAVEHSAVSPVKSAQLALALGAWATGGNGCACTISPRVAIVHSVHCREGGRSLVRGIPAVRYATGPCYCVPALQGKAVWHAEAWFVGCPVCATRLRT